MTELGLITSNTQKNSPGGFFLCVSRCGVPIPHPPSSHGFLSPLPHPLCAPLAGEMFKMPTVAGEATPTQVAQAICNVVLPGNARCTGTIPPLSQ